ADQPPPGTADRRVEGERGMSGVPTRQLGRGIIYLLLGVAAAVALIPLVWLFAATTKGPDDLFHYPFFAPGAVPFLPKLTAVSYRRLVELVPFSRYLVNSLFVCCMAVLVQLFLSSLAGFALA